MNKLDEEILKIINEDEDDFVVVKDYKGDDVRISLTDYENHKSYYDNMCTRILFDNERKKFISNKSNELEKINKEIKEIQKLLKTAYGTNVDYFEEKLNDLITKRNKLLGELQH
jgi:glutathionyl-hydroquinone reductase